MIEQRILDRLYARRRFGIKLGLDVVTGMLSELGDPQDSYAVVHVAGTNGKGSVCAMLESVLHSAGYKTGLYTSPHLVHLNERFRADMCEITDKELSELIDDVELCAETIEKKEGWAPTFFECTTVIALEYFKRAGVQIAVLETGMGGRFDATNVVLPLLSIITRVSMDHTEHLGDTLELIAGEKAGIIKRGRPVVCGSMEDGAVAVIRSAAAESGSLFRYAEETVNIAVKQSDLSGQTVSIDSANGGFGTVHLPLIGWHQVENLALCASAVEEMRDIGVNIDDKAFKAGIAGVQWQGRCQLLSKDPVVILDGAHNQIAAESLLETMQKTLKLKDIALVFGICSDKDVRCLWKINLITK